MITQNTNKETALGSVLTTVADEIELTEEDLQRVTGGALVRLPMTYPKD
jgi:bacteriocin-like protein